MSSVRLDIGGPKGNAFYILALVKTLGRQLGLTAEEQSAIRGRMTGEVLEALGGNPDYENLLLEFKKAFSFVEFYSESDLGIDPSLYTLESESGILEL